MQNVAESAEQGHVVHHMTSLLNIMIDNENIMIMRVTQSVTQRYIIEHYILPQNGASN